MIDDSMLKEELEEIVKTLSKIMGEVAGSKNKIEMDSLEYVLSLVKKYEINYGIVTNFILPGQTPLACAIHITRCVARRAELAYAKVYDEYKAVMEFPHELKANIDGHIYKAGTDGSSMMFLAIDEERVKTKRRWI